LSSAAGSGGITWFRLPHLKKPYEIWGCSNKGT
jgi:hypothetical protein